MVRHLSRSFIPHLFQRRDDKALLLSYLWGSPSMEIKMNKKQRWRDFGTTLFNVRNWADRQETATKYFHVYRYSRDCSGMCFAAK